MLITFNNKTKTLSQWSKEYCLKRSTLKKRLEMGWSMLDAINKPVMNGKIYFGHTAKEWAEKNNMPVELVRTRLRRGWDLDQALNTPPVKDIWKKNFKK